MTLAETAAQMIDGASAWLRPRRAAGADLLVGAEMPSPSEEVWRYVDLDFDLASYVPAAEPGGRMPTGAYLDAVRERSGSAVVIDGHVTETAAMGPAKVVPADSEDAEPVRERIGMQIDPGRDIFTAAHAAFSPAGLVVHVPKNSVAEAPVVIDAQTATDGAAAYPHITLVLEQNSEASVVVVYRSPNGLDVIQVPQVEAHVDDGARLRLTTVQALGAGGRSVAAHQVSLGRDASVRLGEVGLGGEFARLRLGVDLIGAGSSMKAAGLYFGDGTQVHDYRVFITHHGARTSSDLFLKGAVEEEAHAVWTGLVRIEHGADGTSAFETNRNLVLSEGARVDSVPNLEIMTDDLQCGHGSSSGPLEEGHLYYLMSRGMRRERAERLLVRGFFEEIVQNLPSPALADPTRSAVYEKFVAAQQDGRVL